MAFRSLGNPRSTFKDYLSKTGIDAVSAGVAPFSATGGTQSTPGDGYIYHFFTSSATPGFEVISGIKNVDVLIVGGGGGGASYTGSAYVNGLVGNATTFTHPAGPYVVSGGGGGDSYNDTTNPRNVNGGSGGGGGNSRAGGFGYNPATPAPVLAAVPVAQGGPVPAALTLGYPGGASAGVDAGGGGGGAGAAGVAGGPGNSAGGAGLPAFPGATIPASYGTPGPTPGRWFAGGGGAGGRLSSSPGGAGGGGNGVTAAGGESGVANTGGGGGSGDNGSGAGHGGGGAGGFRQISSVPVSVGSYPVVVGAGGAGNPRAGSGGSGIVIVRYLA